MTSGVYVPNITFFTKEGDVDLKKTQAHMRWMIEKGVDGFFLQDPMDQISCYR